MNNSTIALDIIGTVNSPYKEKFAIPRQPNLVKSAKGSVKLINEANNIELVKGLEQFSHIWLLFIFHETKAQGWKPLVRPPRLGGNKKLGVYATRSTFRPNPIGMSAVSLDKVVIENKQVVLHISGLDLLDGTPIVDIKPYIPYSDSITQAEAGFAQQEPESQLQVQFTSVTTHYLNEQCASFPDLKLLISQVLQQDPRPAYKKKTSALNNEVEAIFDKKVYGITLYHFNIKWQLISSDTVEVFEIENTNI